MALDIGIQKQVFLDWELVEPGYGAVYGGEKQGSWEMPYGIRLSVHKPDIRPEPFLRADKPWESTMNVWCSLFKDDGIYRFYYDFHLLKKGETVSGRNTYLGYAESEDGNTWNKPKVGLIEWNGSADNMTSSGRIQK